MCSKKTDFVQMQQNSKTEVHTKQSVAACCAFCVNDLLITTSLAKPQLHATYISK